MVQQGWSFSDFLFPALKKGTQYASEGSDGSVTPPPPAPLPVDQWYEQFLPSDSFSERVSGWFDASVGFVKEHKATVGLVATSLFALLGAAVAAGYICKDDDEDTNSWSLEGGIERKNKSGRGARRDQRRLRFKQTPKVRQLFRPNEQHKKASGGTEDVDDIQGVDYEQTYDLDMPSEVKEKSRKRQLVQSTRQRMFNNECIHYNTCPKQLPVSAKDLCGENCGGHNCIHFAGCQTPQVKECIHYSTCPKKLPVSASALCGEGCGGPNCIHFVGCQPKWVKESHDIQDTMQDMREDMLPDREPPKVVAARRRAVYRARQRKYTYTSKDVAQLGMAQESMLGKVKLNYRKYANCVYKYRVNGQFVQTATVFGDKVHTTLHGYHEGKQEVANFNRVAELPDKIYPTSEDGGVFFHHGVLKGENLQFRPPKNEMAMLISYTTGDESEPNVSVGQISADGYSNFASAKGDCGGIVVAVDDGKIVGTHVAGGKQCNKFEPITEKRVKMWQSTETAILSGMDFQ